MPFRLQQAALILGAMVAYYFIGNYIQHGPGYFKGESPILAEARCKRAALNAKKGKMADPQLLEECRRKGFIR